MVPESGSLARSSRDTVVPNDSASPAVNMTRNAGNAFRCSSVSGMMAIVVILARLVFLGNVRLTYSDYQEMTLTR